MKPVIGLLLIAGGIVLIYGLFSGKIIFPLGGQGSSSSGNANANVNVNSPAWKGWTIPTANVPVAAQLPVAATVIGPGGTPIQIRR